MYNQFNDQLASSTRQYAETAAQINRLALQNVERVFGLQLQALQSNAQAAFGFVNQLLDVRDINGLREAVPAGVQVCPAAGLLASHLEALKAPGSSDVRSKSSPTERKFGCAAPAAYWMSRMVPCAPKGRMAKTPVLPAPTWTKPTPPSSGDGGRKSR